MFSIVIVYTHAYKFIEHNIFYSWPWPLILLGHVFSVNSNVNVVAQLIIMHDLIVLLNNIMHEDNNNIDSECHIYTSSISAVDLKHIKSDKYL